MQKCIFLADNTLFEDLIIRVKRTRFSLDILTFKMETERKKKQSKAQILFEALAAAIARGIRCRLIMHTSQAGRGVPVSNKRALKKLLESGAEVRALKNERVQHAKLIIFDNEDAIIGSHNLSEKSFTENAEISIYFADKILLYQCQQYFDRLWTSGIIYK